MKRRKTGAKAASKVRGYGKSKKAIAKRSAKGGAQTKKKSKGGR